MSLSQHIHPLAGQFWRSAFVGDEDSLLEPARAPMGRWHHNGQPALYLSETPDGCRVATKAYHRNGDPIRNIYPLRVDNAHVIDLRQPVVRVELSITLADLHVFWADLNSLGETPITWLIGDQIRNTGASGILTPSRSRPDLTHLTLFRWNTNDAPTVVRLGAPIAH